MATGPNSLANGTWVTDRSTIHSNTASMSGLELPTVISCMMMATKDPTFQFTGTKKWLEGGLYYILECWELEVFTTKMPFGLQTF